MLRYYPIYYLNYDIKEVKKKLNYEEVHLNSILPNLTKPSYDYTT